VTQELFVRVGDLVHLPRGAARFLGVKKGKLHLRIFPVDASDEARRVRGGLVAPIPVPEHKGPDPVVGHWSE
jgi:hypothetical protein